MTETMYVPRMDAFLNQWFRTYEDAKTMQATSGGFLFPYRHQFFLTTAPAVMELGMDPNDPDWERIGRDWVHPLDREAWARLAQRRAQVEL